jgi:hypothetical protein
MLAHSTVAPHVGCNATFGRSGCYNNCLSEAPNASIWATAAEEREYSPPVKLQIIVSRSSPSAVIEFFRRVPSYVKPSFRGTAMLRSFVGSQRISTLRTRSTSKATRVSAAAASVA